MSEDDLTHSSYTSPRQPRLLADRYDVIDVVGSGASAVTWRGHDRRLERTVAIKILRRDGDQDEAYVQRFEREARTSASISSGNVVNVYDVGQQDGWLYLVMQFVDGEDLKHSIARRGPLPADEARDIASQILGGLAAIHRAGILHRDIKPQNVLIDRDGVARVTDFGIAQTSVDIGLTTAGTAVGTAAYMAPEQAQAGQLDEATDIYAVGVVLYEMLTGVLPFEKPTAMATMLAHIQDLPIPPSQQAPEQHIPPLLDGVVMQAMAKNPADRFRSAAAMARALQGKLNDPGATTRVATLPQDQTRIAPAATRDQVWPAATRPPATPPPRPPVANSTSSGAGGRGLLNAMLVIILLAMTVVAAYMFYEYTREGDTGGDVTPTATIEQVTPTEERDPTEEPVIAPPTEYIAPTEQATVEPTEVPIEPATTEPAADPDQIIEPEGSPNA